MKPFPYLLCLVLILLWQKPVVGQTDWYLSGELSGMYAFTSESLSPRNSRMQKLDLKLQTGAYLSPNWEVHAAVNTYAYAGHLLKEYPPFSFLGFNRYDWLELSHTWQDNSRGLFFSRLDRAYVEYHKNRISLRAGRQIISWGQTLVWSVNDLFNTFTLINLDDMLKQGSDAVRLSFYPAPVSVIEVAAKLNHHRELTAAVMGRTNVMGVEVQLQTGLVEDKDWMIGTAFTGNIDRIGFRSEWAWYKRLVNEAEVKDTWMMVLGAEYIFSNSLVLQTELLYNSLDQLTSAALFNRLVQLSFNPRIRSVSEWSLAVNAAWMLNPRLSFWLASAWLPDYEALTMAPVIQYRLNDSFSLSLNAMYLEGEYQLERQQVRYGMMKVRYGF